MLTDFFLTEILDKLKNKTKQTPDKSQEVLQRGGRYPT